jgi:hypothetical protein
MQVASGLQEAYVKTQKTPENQRLFNAQAEPAKAAVSSPERPVSS